MLEIIERDGLSRICKFTVHNKVVETPTLMPVINPNKIVITPRDMYEKYKLKSLITNSYIIHKNPELRERALTEKLSKMLDYPGIIMTDSGTFQNHVYGDVDLDPQEIVKFQVQIGSDIGTILDIFTEPEFTRDMTVSAIHETQKRGKEAQILKGEMYLAGTVQGSVYPDLRAYSAKLMDSLNFDYYPIGGMVPLLESYRYSEIIDLIISSKLSLSPHRPVHLFGAGHPMFFAFAILLGIDFFDSSSYIKYARADRFLFPDGTRELKDMKYVPYYSPILTKYSIDELKELDSEKRTGLIAEHNLFITVEELERIKTAIFEQSLWEYVEERARSHPALYSALKKLEKYQNDLEKFENLSRKHSFFYTGTESMRRPMVFRLNEKIKNYPNTRETVVVLRQKDLSYSKNFIETFNVQFLVHTPFGFVPYELLGIYPILQSSFPESPEAIDNLKEVLDSWNFKYLISWLDQVPKELDQNAAKIVEYKKQNLDLLKIRAVADYQFGSGAGSALFNDNVKITKSKNTGMIRTVHSASKHLVSLRNDGFFTLKYEGGAILHAHFKYPKMRVVVNKDSEEFNKKGKNVFARFVVDMDDGLKPYDEVLVVNESDQLIAVGRTMMTRAETLSFQRGVIVEIRDVKSDE